MTFLGFVGFPECNFESSVRYLDSIEIDFENRQNMLVVAVGQKVEWTSELLRRNILLLGTWSESYSQHPVTLLMRSEMYIVVKI